MASLTAHRDYLEAEWQRFRTAPLSTRKALLVAALVDAFVDRQFAEQTQIDDVLAFRASAASGSPALARVMMLCRQNHDMRLVTEAVEVPLADYSKLGVEDFMVSLYNNHSVQRLLLVARDGGRSDAMETLGRAIAAIDLLNGER